MALIPLRENSTCQEAFQTKVAAFGRPHPCLFISDLIDEIIYEEFWNKRGIVNARRSKS
jgi:hypothetical protein